MSDSLLPDGIKVSSGKTLDEQPAVCVGFGDLLKFDNATISLVLPLRQAKAFASLILRQAQEIERHGLRVVQDDGA